MKTNYQGKDKEKRGFYKELFGIGLLFTGIAVGSYNLYPILEEKNISKDNKEVSSLEKNLSGDCETWIRGI